MKWISVLVLSMVVSNASQLAISIVPNTNTVHAYYFPNRAAAEGQVIHINNGMTVCYEFTNTSRIFTQVDNGDVVTFKTTWRGMDCSFNMYHPSFSTIQPNIHESYSSGIVSVQNLNIPNYTNRVWHSVAASFYVSNSTPLVFGCVDGTNYSTTWHSSYIMTPLTNVDLTITFTNTQSSWASRYGWEIRNLYIIDTAYTDTALRLLCLGDKSTFDPTKEVKLICSQLKTNIASGNPYYILSSRNLSDWSTIGWVPYATAIYPNPNPNKPTITVTLPYFNEPMRVYQLWRRYDNGY